MPLTLEKKIVAGFAAAAGFMLVIGGAAWWSAVRSAETFRWVDHTHEVLYQLEASLTDMLNMQTATRGYLLTNKESFLEPYEAGSARIGKNLHRLRDLTKDNPAQRERLVRLEGAMERLMIIMRERIALARANNFPAAKESASLEAGNAAIADVRRVIAEMQAEERHLLAARSAAAQGGQRRAGLVFGLGTLLGTALLVVAGLVVRHDFQQRVHAEAELQHERYLLHTLMDHAPDDIYFKDRQSRFLRNNRAHARRLGLADPAQAAGRTDFDFFSEEHARQAHEDELEVLRTGRPVTKEEKETWPDGRVTWALTTKLPLHDERRQIVGTFGLSRDITERKNTEGQIRELNDRLRAQNRQLRAIFESLPGLCLVLHPDLTIVTATDAYLRATLTRREAINGRPLFEVFPDNPDDPSADGVRNLRASLERVRQHGAADTMSIQKYAVRHPDGSFEERYWSPINSPVFGSDRQLEYIIHRIEDVTDFVRQKHAEPETDASLRQRLQRMEAEIFQSSQKVQLANQQLRAANTELEAFSYSVSHDLRAPLRHIDGFASLLQKNSADRLDDQGRRYLTTISDSARQMGRLIDDLLSFSRMGRAVLQPRELEDHNALVTTVIQEGRWERPDRPIDWRIVPLPSVRADQAMLQQVWANLLDNAVKYSGKVPAPRIEIGGHADPATGELVFFVRDNGAGFDMRYADKLFGVFQRLHGPAEFEGTGIGLANVRRIILRHGGRTWAEGTVGRGATFYFSLPAIPTSAAA